FNEMAPGQQSPYSAMSAMAIDPLYIRMHGNVDFEALGGEESLSPADRAVLERVRRSPTVDYTAVRRLKSAALRAAFDRFLHAEWNRHTERARELMTFVASQAWWVEDHSVFRAIHAREGERAWTEWPEDLQRREPAAIDRVRRELANEVLFQQYVQWLPERQWEEARQPDGRPGVEGVGGLPVPVAPRSPGLPARPPQV